AAARAKPAARWRLPLPRSPPRRASARAKPAKVDRGALEKALPDVDHVVGAEQVGGPRRRLGPAAGGGLAAQLRAALRAARREAAGERNRLHHRHAGLEAIAAAVRHLAVDV